MFWGFTLLMGTLPCAAQSTTGLPSDINSDSRARLPYLQRKNLDEAGQKIYDVLPGRRPDGSLSGPLAFAAYNPAVAKALFDLHNAAVAGTLPPTCANSPFWWRAAKPITTWNGTLTNRVR